MSQLVSSIKLIRSVNCVVAGIAVWVGAYMTLAPIDFWPALIASICAFLIAAVGNIHNDICDVEIDRVAHPARVLVSGQLTIKVAKGLAVVLSVAALGLGCLLGLQLWSVLAGVLVILLIYNRWLKWVPLAGNVVVAGIAAMTFIVGGLVSEPSSVCDLPGPIIPAAFGFLIHLMRELTKDVLDMDGDRTAGQKTLPLLIGVRPVLILVFAIGIVLAWSLYQPYAREWYGVRYWIVALAGVLPPTLGMSLVAIARPRRSVISALSTSLKLSMLVGLVALYLA